jgi:GAF domain-containing protein
VLREDAALGVLEVLDCAPVRSATESLILATEFAAQAAIALDLLRRDLATTDAVSSAGQGLRDLVQLSDLVGSMDSTQRAVALRLLTDVRTLTGRQAVRP